MCASFCFVSLKKGLFYGVAGLADEAEGSDHVWLSFLSARIYSICISFHYLCPSRILSIIQVDVILIEAGNAATLSSHNLTFFIL